MILTLLVVLDAKGNLKIPYILVWFRNTKCF